MDSHSLEEKYNYNQDEEEDDDVDMTLVEEARARIEIDDKISILPLLLTRKKTPTSIPS